MTDKCSPEWLESLGSFDEESCRFFLHDVGNHIVPCYPFSLGIQEVYGLIIERYGMEGASDATSVLQELLEDEHNACGIGDDGDIWRSWRYHWRHRNDDEYHPFVPRAGSLVLFPATSPCIRRLKAENFIRQRSGSGNSSTGFSVHSELCRNNEKDSQDDGTVSQVEEHDTSSAALLSLELLRALEETHPSHDRPVNESTNDASLQKRTDSANILTNFPVPPLTPPALSRAWTVCGKELNTQGPTHSKPNSRAEKQTVGKVLKGEGYLCIRGHCSYDNGSCLAGMDEAVAEETTRSDNCHNKSDLSTAATNRQARLIDGTIFTSGNGKEKCFVDSQNTSGTPNNFSHLVAKKLSRCSASPRRSLRDSWSRGLRQLSLVEKFDWLTIRQGKRRSTVTQSDTTSSRATMPPQSQQPHIFESPDKLFNVGLDGATDSVMGSSASSVNLNKPLPPNPGLTCSTETLNSPVSWRSLSLRTPTHEHHVPISPAQPPPPLDLKKLRNCASNERQRKGSSMSSLVSTTQPSSRSHCVYSNSTAVNNTHPKNGPSHNLAARGRTSETKITRSQSTKAKQLVETPEMPETPSKRSRSPFKRLLGMSKSGHTNNDQIPQTPARPKTPTNEKKSSIKRWGEKIRYGFLNPEEEQLLREDLIEKHVNSNAPAPQLSSFPVSLEPPSQAKLHSEIELYVAVTANAFLLNEARAGRLSAESVEKVKNRWEKMGRPQVLEFHYDQATQHRLVTANTRTVKFCGDASKDIVQITAILNGWMVLAREMSVRTLSSPDSMLRKHLHDTHRLLELLGAPLVTSLAFENMQVKVLQMINQRQKERIDRKRNKPHARSFSDGARFPSSNSSTYEREYTAESFQLDKVRLSPSPTPVFRREGRKATGAEGAIMSLPNPLTRKRIHASPAFSSPPVQARRDMLDKPIQEKPENLLL